MPIRELIPKHMYEPVRNRAIDFSGGRRSAQVPTQGLATGRVVKLLRPGARGRGCGRSGATFDRIEDWSLTSVEES